MFLSSLAALALVSITSRQSPRHSTSTLVLYRSSALKRSVSTPAEISSIEGRGTRVSARKLFEDFPVRSKRHDMLDEQDYHGSQLNDLRRRVVALLIAWPHIVSVTLCDEFTRAKMNFVAPSMTGALSGHTATAANRISHESNNELRLLTQAGYITPEDWVTWIPVSGSTATFSVCGAISMDPMPTQRYQFISIGCDPVDATRDQNELYEVVNRLFSESSFGNMACPGFCDECRIQNRCENHGCPPVGQRVLFSKFSAKRINRWPMFYLRVQFKETRQEHDFLSPGNAAGAQFQSVAAGLTAMMNKWLTKHRFRKESTKQSAPNTASHGLEKYAHDATKGKTTRSLDALENPRPLISGTHTSPNMFTDSTGIDGRPWSVTSTAMRPPKAQVAREPLRDPISRMSSTEYNWSKMRVGSLHSANQRDAKEVQSQTTSPVNDTRKLQFHHPAFVNTALNRRRTTVLKPCSTSQEAKALGGVQNIKKSSDTWPANLLSRWENPVFRSTEDAGHGSNVTFGETAKTVSYLRSLCRHQDVQRLSAKGLRRARVIAQLDSKFVLLMLPACAISQDNCRSNSEEQQLLAVLDQHAADERCILEQLLLELCETPPRTPQNSEPVSDVEDHARSTQLPKAITFRVDSRDNNVLQACAARFASWGVAYKIEPARDQSLSSKNGSSLNLTVESLPAGVAERCSAEPTLLLNVLRREAWEQREHGGRAQQHVTLLADEHEHHPWLRQLSDCPRGIIDMLISRACRSAIMFNDSLTLDECRSLCSRLANCALPFQCAHGRPSLVPVANLGTADGECYGTLPSYPSWRDESFVAAHRAWMQGTGQTRN